MILQRNNSTTPTLSRITLGIACLFLVVVGTGCGDDEPETQEIPELTRGKVITQPTDTDIFNLALDACEESGYEGLMHFDDETKETTIYCAFTETTGCDVLAFQAGACGPGNAITLPARAALAGNIRTCDTSENPVCGEDGNTYVNECIALLQKVSIKKEGVCGPEDKAVLVKDVETVKKQLAASGETGGTSGGNGSGGGNSGSNGSGSSGSAGGPGNGLGGGVSPDRWVPFLVTTMASPNTLGGARIEKCTLGSRTVYYQQDSCPECFSTLYDRGGNVLCYPHNDITNKCPGNFDKDNRSSCELLWSKK